MVITSSLRIARFDSGLLDSGSKSAIRMDLKSQVDVNVISAGGWWILLEDTNRPGGDQRRKAGGLRLETLPARRIHEENFNGDGWAGDEKASGGGMKNETNIRCPDK